MQVFGKESPAIHCRDFFFLYYTCLIEELYDLFACRNVLPTTSRIAMFCAMFRNAHCETLRRTLRDIAVENYRMFLFRLNPAKRVALTTIVCNADKINTRFALFREL